MRMLFFKFRALSSSGVIFHCRTITVIIPSELYLSSYDTLSIIIITCSISEILILSWSSIAWLNMNTSQRTAGYTYVWEAHCLPNISWIYERGVGIMYTVILFTGLSARPGGQRGHAQTRRVFPLFSGTEMEMYLMYFARGSRAKRISCAYCKCKKLRLENLPYFLVVENISAQKDRTLRPQYILFCQIVERHVLYLLSVIKNRDKKYIRYML